MPGRLADADANNILDVRFGASAVTGVPGTYYVGLSTTLPTSAGGNVTEPTTGGYGRVGVANNTTNWPAATGRSKSNGTAITFPVPTANWGTIGWFVLYDALSAGVFHGWGELAPSQAVNIGAIASFAPGQLVISLPGT